MERMIIRHLSGSKANQVEEFPLNHYGELTFGRDDSAIVRYDPDRDDLVGRQHARIRRDPNDPNVFYIEDLNSRNGTFLNKRRLNAGAAAKLQAGDSVNFGPGGPEFVFDLEPRPANVAKATRIAEPAMVSGGGKIAPETRVTGGGMSSSVPTAPAAAMGGGKATVGKATVERMISHTVTETKKAQGRKYGVIGGAAALAVLLLFGVVIGGSYWYSSRREAALKSEMDSTSNKAVQLENESAELKKKLEEEKANSPLAAAEITEKYQKAVVFIQGSWQLTNQESKSQMYHQFIPNDRKVLSREFKENFGEGQIIPNGPSLLPVYVQTQSGHEPYLTTEKSSYSQPIGGSGTCSGVIVTTNGFILTNKHCSSPWKAPYSFPQNYPPGVLIGMDGKIAGLVEAPRGWIPENTKGGPRQFQGSYEATQKITVMLPGSDNPIEARKIRDNPRHDVGMLKIDMPGTLPKVELFDSYDTLKKGEGLVIMGYPGSAPATYKAIQSQNPLDQETKYSVVPEVTVTVTSVGNIVRNTNSNDPDKNTRSIAGDSIRYAGGLTYGGNSGGPVFDMKGRVIGLHYLGDSGNLPGNFSGMAVPIRYGMELFPGGEQ